MVHALLSQTQATVDAAMPLTGSFSLLHLLAAMLVAAGLVALVSQRRRASGAGVSLFLGGLTAAAALLAIEHDWPAAAASRWPAAAETASVSTTLAVLAAVWSLAATLTRRRDQRATLVGRSPISPAFAAWALVCGVIAAAITAYVMLAITTSRLLDAGRLVDLLPLTAIWNIILLLLATLFWAVSGPRPRQPLAALVLTALLVWCTSLLIPSAVGTHRFVARTLLPGQPIWWTWTLHLQLGLGLLLLIAALLQEVHYRRRRGAAWPDRLDDLLAPYSRWPGFIQTEAVIAAAVLLLGVFQIVQPGPPSWPAVVGNALASTIAGTTCMFMTYRRWSANTTGLAIALLTLAAVALACAFPEFYHRRTDATAYAERLPVLYNAALFALALMIAWWSWLARFWDQQLLDGFAWTTSGRMIPYAYRAAFLLAAVAVLVAFQMALWPRRVLPSVEDNSPARMIAGTLAILMLAVVTARNARRLNSSATAAFGLAFVAAALLLLHIRLPAAAWKGWMSQYDTVAYSGLALPMLAAAELLPKTRWRCFAVPLWWVAVVILPGGAMLELLLSPERPAAEWIRPATFGLLSLVYLLAGSRRHRRAILVLGGVCLLAAATSAYRVYH